MNSKTTRKRRCDRNHVIYIIRNNVTNQDYIGLTALAFAGNARRTVFRRIQKHIQRAATESKDWALSNSIRTYGNDAFTFGIVEIVRGKKEAHQRETELINTLQPKMNTFRTGY